MAGADWDVRPVPPRVVAIGDLHGDVRAFGAIAQACGLVDEAGTWAGKDTHLVLMGDLVGGARSRLLLEAIRRLEREAVRAGGRVHALLGNHDVLPAAGRFGKMSRKERRSYAKDDFRGEGRFSE
jgi:3',5'-cyclic AMP phosphodiesterase CpdA